MTMRDDKTTVGLFKIPSSNPLLKVKKKKSAKQTKIAQIKREKEHKQIEETASQHVQNQNSIWHYLSGIATEDEVEKSRIGMIGGANTPNND